MGLCVWVQSVKDNKSLQSRAQFTVRECLMDADTRPSSYTTADMLKSDVSDRGRPRYINKPRNHKTNNKNDTSTALCQRYQLPICSFSRSHHQQKVVHTMECVLSFLLWPAISVFLRDTSDCSRWTLSYSLFSWDNQWDNHWDNKWDNQWDNQWHNQCDNQWDNQWHNHWDNQLD